MKLDVKAFALAWGIIWGAVMFVMTLIAALTGYGSVFAGFFTTIYPGYSVTVVGSFIGGVYGFLDMGILCLLFALLYNKLAK